MRVLTVTNMYPSPAAPTFGIFVREQVEDLRAHGAAVEVLAFDGRARPTAYAEAAAAVRARVHERPFDVVHAHYGLTGAAALAQRRVPVVTTFHGSDAGPIAWQRCVSWVVARRSRPIFVAAHGAARLGVANPVVIPCGVDLEVFRVDDRGAARTRLGWADDRVYVLLPGSRRSAVKGSELFHAVIARLQRARRDVEPVTLEGFARATVGDVFNAVDVTLMTSRSEGSPVSVKESLACETPVVSVPVGDVEAVLAGLPGCAVVPRDPDRLADAVLATLATRRTGALRARAERYARPRVAGRVLAVLGEAAARP